MRHRRMLAPINTVKHYIPNTSANTASGAIRNVLVAQAVVAPATSAVTDVKEGSILKAIFIEIWIASNEVAGSESFFNITIEKKRSTETDMTAAQSAGLQAYPNKKNILYTTQGIVNSNAVSGSVPIVRQWFAIPKGKQRFGLGDQMMYNISAVSGALQNCGISIYKEYT